MNLASKINCKGEYDEEFNGWLLNLKSINPAESRINFKHSGLYLQFKLIAFKDDDGLYEFTEGKRPAKVVISSVARESEVLRPSIQTQLVDYKRTTHSEYDYMIHSIRHLINGREKYVNSYLITLYDLLYLIEFRFGKRISLEPITLTYKSAIRFALNKDEVFELFSSFMRFINNK